MNRNDTAHVDPDALVLIAMGESSGSPDEARHIDTCTACAGELRSLRRVAELGRSGTREDALGTPGPAVWAGISQTLGLSGDVSPAPFADAEPELTAAPSTPDAPDAATSATRRPRRHKSARRRWVPLVGVAAAVAILGGIAGAIALQQPAEPEVLADASLDALPDWAGSSGAAVVEAEPEGARTVVVNVEAASAPEGYQEVWLIKADLSGLVSIGVLDGTEGRFVIPEGLDLADYPGVDVSDEPLDGDPAHSGNSIVRGTLGS